MQRGVGSGEGSNAVSSTTTTTKKKKTTIVVIYSAILSSNSRPLSVPPLQLLSWYCGCAIVVLQRQLVRTICTMQIEQAALVARGGISTDAAYHIAAGSSDS